MSDRAIIEAVNKMTGRHKSDEVTYINAIVDSVDVKNRTCSCTAVDGHTEYKLPTVKLMAVVDDGVLFEPVIGSTVKVIFSQNIEPFICQYSEIENITIDARTRIKLNDGTFGGLIKIKELVDKINNLEKDINSLKTAFSTWIPVPSDGGLALKVGTAAWTGQRLTETKVNDIENKLITHGK
jgi:hypothetical protein